MTDLRSDSRVVQAIRVVVHSSSALGPNTPMSDNHWSIYLIFANTDRSVRINMRANYGDPTGILEWSPDLPYNVTRSLAGYWDYSVAPGVTVGWLCQLVLNNGRDRYDMSGGGSGCHYWV